MAFLKNNNIYSLQMFDFDGQEDDQAAYDLSPYGEHRWAFSRGNCNS